MTTDTKDVHPTHPMVLKAARGLCREIARQMEESESRLWAEERDKLILAAHAALTECGALECLEALEASQDPENYTEDTAERMASDTLVKVYGSAPE